MIKNNIPLFLIFFLSFSNLSANHYYHITAFSTCKTDNYDSTYSKNKVRTLKRCSALYKNARSSFDDNFNFTSEPMIKMLSEIRTIAEQYNEADSLLSDVYGKIAICHQDLGNDADALHFLRQAKGVRKKKNPDRSLFYIYITLGSLFMKSYEYDSAEYYFTKIEDHLHNFAGLRKSELYRLWNELGVLHYNYGDYKLSLAYYEQALQNGTAVFSKESDQIVTVQNNIIVDLLKLDKLNEAIQKYRALLPYNKSLPILYHNLGKTYQRALKYDSSLFYLKKAELIAASNDVLNVKLFNNMAVTYIGLKDYGQAQHYLNQSISLNTKSYKTKNAALAYSYMNKAKIAEQQNNLTAALKHYQTALTILHFNFTDTNIYRNPDNLLNVVSRPYFFECLTSKAAVLKKHYNESHQQHDLLASFSTYSLSIQMMNTIGKSYSSQESKLIFNTNTHNVYEDAIAVTFELYKQTNKTQFKNAAFAFSEQSKMAVLSEATKDLKFKNIAGIPKDVMVQERKLKQNISRLLVRLGDARDSMQRNQLQNDLIANEIALSRIQQLFEKNKKYQSLKYSQNPLQFSEISDRLHDNEALIEYQFAGSDVYIFVATSNDLTVTNIKLTNHIYEDLEKLKEALYSNKDGSIYHGQKTSHAIYKALLAPIMPLVKNKKRWIVISDGLLNYVPFEAFVTNLKQNRFLIEDYAIRYAYASEFLFQSNNQSSTKQKSLLAFAPFSNTIHTVSDMYLLNGSKKEIQTLPGIHYFDKAATKSKFISQAKSFDIIHLATHAKTFSENPLRSFIAFSTDSNQQNYESRLYMSEIYNIDLTHTKMVVISACEAGGGKLMKGEGLMSLSRAFAVAGCHSIITSLWKTDDEASAILMTSLYKYLCKGYTKDEALRYAKIEYLQSNESRSLKSPVFWANFICIGNADALYTENTIDNRLTALCCIIGTFLLLFYLVKKSASNTY